MSGDNWLKQEFDRARERSSQLPPYARPMVIRGGLMVNARLRAVLRMLIDSGDITPMGVRQIGEVLKAEDITDQINEIQGWCPQCGGSGVVMEFQPEDCPNIGLHVLLQSLITKQVD